MKVCGPSQKASAMKAMEVFQLGGKAGATRTFLATGPHHTLIYFFLAIIELSRRNDILLIHHM